MFITSYYYYYCCYHLNQSVAPHLFLIFSASFATSDQFKNNCNENKYAPKAIDPSAYVAVAVTIRRRQVIDECDALLITFYAINILRLLSCWMLSNGNWLACVMSAWVCARYWDVNLAKNRISSSDFLVRFSIYQNIASGK